MSATKVCARCALEKPVETFAPTHRRPRKSTRVIDDPRHTADGRKRICRACYKRSYRRLQGIMPKAPKKPPTSRPRNLHRDLQTLLRRLLGQRCEQQGINVAGVIFRARYHADAAFRQKQRERTLVRRHATGGYSYSARRVAAVERADGTLTPQVIAAMFASVSVCPYCDRPMTARQKTLDHVIPLARGGVHGISNTAIVCSTCNVRKHARLPTTEQQAAAAAQRAWMTDRLRVPVHQHVAGC